MHSSLLWICSTLTPYNSFLFRALHSEPQFDLKVVTSKKYDPRHPWSTDLGSGFIVRPMRQFLWIDWRLVGEAIKPNTDMVVIAGWNTPTVILVSGLLAILGLPFALWTDTPDVHSERKLLKSILRKRWLLWIFHHARVVMGTGDPAIQALKSMGCPANKIVKFPFFVDLGHYNKRSGARNDVKTKCFVSVGRVENAVKAHDIAIQAFARMQNNNDFSSEWEYIVVGSGPDVDNLRELVAALGLSDNVIITGWMEPNEVRKILEQAHVFVHPSLRDAYPAAVLEAMAVGLPVIGSNASGSVLDRVVHQENGLVHTAGDVSELSDQLEWSMINFEKIIDMGREARVTAETWPVSKAIEIIHDVVNGQ